MEEISSHRPAHVITKARREYDRVLAERLFIDSSYTRAVKAALRAYDKVLRDYDRTRNRSN